MLWYGKPFVKQPKREVSVGNRPSAKSSLHTAGDAKLKRDKSSGMSLIVTVCEISTVHCHQA